MSSIATKHTGTTVPQSTPTAAPVDHPSRRRADVSYPSSTSRILHPASRIPHSEFRSPTLAHTGGAIHLPAPPPPPPPLRRAPLAFNQFVLYAHMTHCHIHTTQRARLPVGPSFPERRKPPNPRRSQDRGSRSARSRGAPPNLFAPRLEALLHTHRQPVVRGLQ